MEISESDREDSHRKINLARELAAREDYAGALTLANEVLDVDFNNALALFMAGYCMMRTERFGLAYNLFRRCSQLQPDRSEPWNNAGMCHQETWNLDDAELCFRKALQLEPNNTAAIQNLALIYVNRCLPEEAMKWVRRAETAGTVSWECMDNKALALLMLRQWRDGWQAYSQTAGRHKQRQLRFYNTPEEPRWQGEPGAVVVYGVQGIGDEISFASCIPDMKADVIIDCDHRLEGIFRRSFPKAEVHGTRFRDRDWERHVDYSIPIDCLPHLFRNDDHEFPGAPYLVADPERRLQWRALLDTFRRPVIGIAWNGGINNTGKKKRSLGLSQMLPIMKAIPATWISLEYRDRTDQIRQFREETGIEILDYPRATRTDDYDDTAGLVAELDLVISVTTAVVHLSGALGKDCWCLAPNKPRWFYGLEGDLPWYKSVRMFRQAKNGTWPIEDVEKLLKLRYGPR
jgi:Tfp pilus assembly protein PilF